MPFGFTDEQWLEAKNELRRLLVARAKLQSVVAYSKAAATVSAIGFDPEDPRYHAMLGEISNEEDEAGRGLLSAVVVYKSGDMMPGPGFFKLASSRDRNVSNIQTTWVTEVSKVWEYWGQTATGE